MRKVKLRPTQLKIGDILVAGEASQKEQLVQLLQTMESPQLFTPFDETRELWICGPYLVLRLNQAGRENVQRNLHVLDNKLATSGCTLHGEVIETVTDGAKVALLSQLERPVSFLGRRLGRGQDGHLTQDPPLEELSNRWVKEYLSEQREIQ